MTIQEQLMKVDPELLVKALEFAAHALNDTKVVRGACEEVGIPVEEGYALAQFFAELGMQGETSITNMATLNRTASEIKDAMPNIK